ncbi:MAG: phosphoenolpyruvate-utilizing N-terminal domain-containing protein, partial [bacterium]|nr:phosphoenolpyruvate-utilizing N-terminal domain-containing protein [bacterium]
MVKSDLKKMVKLRGIAASPGVIVGSVYKLTGDVLRVEERGLKKDEVAQEIKKFNRALKKTHAELSEIQNQARQKIGKEAEKIFDAHQLLLDDMTIIDETISKIQKQQKNADFVYFEVMQQYQKSLENVDNEYFMGRVADIKDVKRRLIRNIQGGKAGLLSRLTRKAIIVAYDLSPSDTVLLEKQKVQAFATDRGGKNSHAAIMARAMAIPSVVGLKELTRHCSTGDTIIIDGGNGDIILNPTPTILNKYLKLREEYDESTKQLSKIRDLPCRTLDGKDVELSANLDFPDEFQSVINYGAHGVGLFRTEYIYMSSKQLPSEDDEYQEYFK